MALIVVKKEKVVEFELDKEAIKKTTKKVLIEKRSLKNQQPKKTTSHYVANF